MDITLALLPWEILRHLTMNKKEKIAVMLAMSMGVLYVDPPFSVDCDL
jgi:hypothetical protein